MLHSINELCVICSWMIAVETYGFVLREHHIANFPILATREYLSLQSHSHILVQWGHMSQGLVIQMVKEGGEFLLTSRTESTCLAIDFVQSFACRNVFNDRRFGGRMTSSCW